MSLKLRHLRKENCLLIMILENWPIQDVASWFIGLNSTHITPTPVHGTQFDPSLPIFMMPHITSWPPLGWETSRHLSFAVKSLFIVFI